MKLVTLTPSDLLDIEDAHMSLYRIACADDPTVAGSNAPEYLGAERELRRVLRRLVGTRTNVVEYALRGHLDDCAFNAPGYAARCLDAVGYTVVVQVTADPTSREVAALDTARRDRRSYPRIIVAESL